MDKIFLVPSVQEIFKELQIIHVAVGKMERSVQSKIN